MGDDATLESAPAGEPPRYLNAGECALVVEFGRSIEPSTHDRVVALDEAIAAAAPEGVIETVPTYRSLTIHFDPALTSSEALIEAIKTLQGKRPRARRRSRWRVPVCYDPPLAEDLGEVGESLGLAADEIITLHSGALYRVYMYGFAPGYVFLGGLPEALTISRRAAPRPPIPPGSLLIAGGQALIASVSMPTGWYQIGRTPVRVFDSRREPMVFAQIGDEILFERIDALRFEELILAAQAGELVAWPDAQDPDAQAPKER
jgi:inhibitor of KinA